MAHEDLPAFDDNGINLADPHDSLGHKTAYISLLQAKALERYVGAGAGLVLDVGCGYGRMSDALAGLGYDVVGMEPSLRVLRTARQLRPQHAWCVGRMPDLPFADNSFGQVCLLNVARALYLLQIEDVCRSLGRLVKPGGRLIVIDNLRRGDSRYLPEGWFDETFARDGLRLVCKVAIRASRWPLIYLIRYGLIPRRWFETIANWELRRMARKTRTPRLSYHNYLFVYEKS